jgi:heterodisulfide reductase subunit C
MDYKPHQVMQMANQGRIAPLLSSRSIWVCASCYTCSTRCPNEVDVAGVMDGLRQRALVEKAVPAEARVRLFHRAFLGEIRAHGRVHELSMMARYKMATRTYLDDMRLGWRMFLRGKLKLLPSLVRDRKEIARLFTKEDKEDR